jgi:beta-lactamase class A
MKNPAARNMRGWKLLILMIAACGVAFFAGWFSHNWTERNLSPDPLRLSGYPLIDPILSCNFNALGIFPQDQSMNSVIQSVIAKHENAGDISKASVYFADFSNSQWSFVNPSDRYYPSSLGKIPIMMAYYELAESSSAVLDQQITYPVGSADLNASQDITPPEAIIPGNTYSVEDLIKYMIQDSDNNAAQLLYQNLDPDSLHNLYAELQIPTDSDVTLANADFITPQQIGTLFRVLYNGTYLSHDFSEKALELMTGSTFAQGIVAGVPSSTVIAHKLGLVVITSGGVTTEHELHDCGIVYAPSHPYLLCIMTRGSLTLATMENTLADISQTVYQKVETGD